jgi:hypothetical protein
MAITETPWQPTIAELIHDSGLGQTEVARRAQRRGFPLTQGKVERFTAVSPVEYPKPASMEALAAGLNVPYGTVVAAFTMSLRYPREWHGPY